jgi:hypothetical protein
MNPPTSPQPCDAGRSGVEIKVIIWVTRRGCVKVARSKIIRGKIGARNCKPKAFMDPKYKYREVIL